MERPLQPALQFMAEQEQYKGPQLGPATVFTYNWNLTAVIKAA